MCGICGETWDFCNCDEDTFSAQDENYDIHDEVDETNYNPYLGADEFEYGNDIDFEGGDW